MPLSQRSRLDTSEHHINDFFWISPLIYAIEANHYKIVTQFLFRNHSNLPGFSQCCGRIGAKLLLIK